MHLSTTAMKRQPTGLLLNCRYAEERSLPGLSALLRELLALEEAHRILVQLARGRGDHPARAEILAAAPVADRAAGGADQRDQRVIVIGLEAAFDDEVERAGGQAGIAVA